MATESIHKKKNFDKKQLAEKLEVIATNVSNKGIYVVEQNTYNFYNLLDYKTKTVIINDIPHKAIADKLCIRYNKYKKLSRSRLNKVKQKIDYYIKLYTDCVYYQRTVLDSADEVLVDAVQSRLYLSQQQMKKVFDELIRMC